MSQKFLFQDVLPEGFPELWVLRHGETEWNVEGRLQGYGDSPLTERGIAQAKAQKEILSRVLPSDVSALVSPSGRALHTARLALEGLNLNVVQDSDLREINVGEWQGRLVSEVAPSPEEPGRSDPHSWKFGAPGGETLATMTERVGRVLSRLQSPTVLVTHGLTSRLLRCLVLGHPTEQLSELPGGQGVVHHIKDGRAQVLRPD